MCLAGSGACTGSTGRRWRCRWGGGRLHLRHKSLYIQGHSGRSPDAGAIELDGRFRSVPVTNGRSDMPKNARKSGPDLLALAMRRTRDDVAAGKVPKRPPETGADNRKGTSKSPVPESRSDTPDTTWSCR